MDAGRNFPVPIDSAALASALTEERWQDRILGVMDEARLRIRCVWMAAGNNLEWSHELARRIVSIRLLAPTERPWERGEFRHDPLEGWAAEHRCDLLRACLILCRHWIAKGRPQGKRPFGSYETYAKVMGGILDSIGVPGFLENQAKASEATAESTSWPALVLYWHQRRGECLTSASDLWDLIYGNSEEEPPIPANPELKIAFADILGDGQPTNQKKRLGKALARNQDRVWGDFRIVRTAVTSPTGNAVYRLQTAAREAGIDVEETVPF
jgi:putative DNA primase/helicase